MGLKVTINGEDKELNKIIKEKNGKKEVTVEISKTTNKQVVAEEKDPKANKKVTVEMDISINKKEEQHKKTKDWIQQLEFTDEATKVMLQNVVKRKQKFSMYERKHLITMICMFICVLGYLVYLYNEILKPYSYSLGDVFHAMLSSSINGYVLIIIFGLYATMEYFFKKREKAEKEFHKLRCEIIDKSKDLWREEAWKHRADVFEKMKKNHDINLYHENK